MSSEASGCLQEFRTIHPALQSRQGEEAIKQLDERRAARQILDDDDSFDTISRGLKRGMWFVLEMEKGTRARCRLTFQALLY